MGTPQEFVSAIRHYKKLVISYWTLTVLFIISRGIGERNIDERQVSHDSTHCNLLFPISDGPLMVEEAAERRLAVKGADVARGARVAV